MTIMTMDRSPTTSETLDEIRKVHDFLRQGTELYGVEDVIAADRNVLAARDVVIPYAERVRGRAIADLFHITGMPGPKIGRLLGYSRGAAPLWIDEHGADRYLMLEKSGADISATFQKASALKYLRGLGHRVAPSTFDLVDWEGPRIRWDGTMQELWDHLPELVEGGQTVPEPREAPDGWDAFSFLLTDADLFGLADVIAADRAVLGARLIADWAEMLRAQTATDAVFLQGVSMRALAGKLGYGGHRTVVRWVNELGAKKYVTVVNVANRAYQIEVYPRDGVRLLLNARRRIAPAVLSFYDNASDSVTFTGSARQLWRQLPDWTNK
jgi:hypothetical protein